MQRSFRNVVTILGLVFAAACAAVPTRVQPQGPAIAIQQATLAVVAHDFVTPDETIGGAVVEIRNGALVVARLETKPDGYAEIVLPRGEQYDITISKAGYATGTASEFLTGNSRIPIALVKGAPPAPPFVVASRPLVGPLRVQDKRFVDDSGYRRVLFASWFTALRTFRENPAEFNRQIDVLADAGYQGARVFMAVGGWSEYWDGHEVLPVGFKKWFFNRDNGGFLDDDRARPGRGAVLAAWSDFDDVWRGALRAFKVRRLRFDVTTGDMQIIVGNDQAKELELHRRLARIAAEEGGLDVIALVEGTNEFPINRYGGGSDASIEQLHRILDIWRQAIPAVLTTEGAVISEEPERLLAGARYGQVAAVHVSRDPFEMFVKRTFGLTNWEGNWRFFPLPFWHTEPLGPGKDSYAVQNDPANLTAAYAMPMLLGHAVNYFNGPAVRADGPLESTWGFRELPKILSVLPEDVSAWDHGSDGRGGIAYFFRGKQFATSTVAAWNTAPPMPVAEWTLYAGDRVTSGTGNPPTKVTGLLVGRFQ